MARFTRKNRGKIEEFKKIYIFCEGKKTEPIYFEKLKKEIKRSGLIKIEIDGTGFNTLSLMKYAIGKMKKLKIEKEDEVWVVFDEDTKEKGDFENTIHMAQSFNKKVKYDFNVAYSNECFELWYLLHFRFSTSQVGQTEYYKEFRDRLNELDPTLKMEDYETEGKNIDLYTLLKPLQKDAMKNAKQLETYWERDGEKVFAKQKPSTTVHLLVESLNSLKE